MKKVLIVDDSLELGRFLQAALTTLDPPVDSAVVPSAEEAILDARFSTPDLLISDIRLPGISGVDLVRKMQVLYPKLKSILITGLDRSEFQDQIKELNVEAFLSKPMVLSEFLDVVSNALGAGLVSNEEVALRFQNQHGQEKKVDTLSAILSDLRQVMNAKTVFIQDHLGRVRAQAGELPNSNFESHWIPAMAELISIAKKVSDLVGGREPRNVMTFQGENLDLVIAPIGKYALILVMENGYDDQRLASAFQQVREAQFRLLEILRAKGLTGALPALPPQQSEPVSPVVEETEPLEEDLDEFASLFDASLESSGLDEADEFWQEQIEKSKTIETIRPDLISFQQAQQLGLTPDEEK